MKIEELEQIAESVHAGNAKYDFEINVCNDLALPSQGAGQLRDALMQGGRGVRQRTSSSADRLHGTLLRRAAGARRSRRNPLSPCQSRRMLKPIVASLGGEPGSRAAVRSE